MQRAEQFVSRDLQQNQTQGKYIRRVTDQGRGITRRRVGRGFIYFRPDGSRLQDLAELRRIRSLAIPPAWTEVWICTRPDGHIQATGRDARRRKQYRYHARWSEARDKTKYHRMLDFAHRLPVIRRRVGAHLGRDGLSREKVLAAVVRLLALTSIRVGNSEYAKDNNSYGLTTLRRKHVRVNGPIVTFQFMGKGHIRHQIQARDLRVAAIVRQCLALPGIEVFKYINDDGKVCDVTAPDVNDYLRSIGGSDFSAKDFRTWTATVITVLELLQGKRGETEKVRKSQLLQAIDRAAERLGNTRAICRKAYLHPCIEEHYLKAGFRGTERLTRGRLRGAGGETTVLKVIRRLHRP